MNLTKLICILISVAFAIFISNSRHKPSTITPVEAKLYASQLSGHTISGVPLIVFASDHCPYSNQLEQELKDGHLPYIRADVENNSIARNLTRNTEIGTITPTIVIGTKVVRGGNVKGILSELAEQRLNRDFWP